MAERKLRVGIIGCGALGLVHAQRFEKMPEAEVAALSDTNETAMQRVADALAKPPGFRRTDYRDILGSGLDAVCIASPDSVHVEQVLASLDAGLHVLCEKPLTPYADQLQAVIDRSRTTGLTVSMTYPRRYDGPLRAMRREILSGKWGRVTGVAITNCEDWITPNAGTWRHDPAICPGGFFYDANGHQIDTLFWMTGLKWERIQAKLDRCGTPVPMRVWGEAALTGGIPFTFSFFGDAHSWRETIAIHCEGMDFFSEQMRALWTPDGRAVPIADPEPNEDADDAFIPLTRGQGHNWAPPSDLWPVLEFTAATLRAAESGEEVRA